MAEAVRLKAGQAPHIVHKAGTQAILWGTAVSLLPAGVWGFFLFGTSCAYVLAVAVGSALFTELLTGFLLRRFSLLDGSAFLTGLLVGYLTPPSAPLYIPAASSFFAIAVVKQSFGGLGRNWMNPALAGRIFALFSWGGSAGVQGTPLSVFMSALAASGGAQGGPFEVLSSKGFPFSAADASVTGWLNTNIFLPLGAHLPGGALDILIGRGAATVGEAGALLVLAGGIWLIARKRIRWEIPLLYAGTFIVLVWSLGGLRGGEGYFAGNIFFHVFSGGFILGALYNATDPVSSPLTFTGRVVYGALLGTVTFLLRMYGSFAEGVLLAIILCNCAVPVIDSVTRTWRRSTAGGQA